MPGIDGSGPMGAGPMTGRGLGPCAGVNDVRYGAGFGRGFGRGFGFGRGRAYGCGFGRGFGRGFGWDVAWNQPSSRTQKELLQEQRDILKGRLDAIDEELEDL